MPQPQGVSPADALNVRLPSRSATEALGKTIGRVLTGGETLALIGDLGVGKTTLIRGIAAGLGIPPASVSSPTFVLIHEYRGRLPLIHIDFYRLRTSAEAESIGLRDYLTGEPVTAIEWADRFSSLLPKDRLEVHLAHRSPTTRSARLEARGPQSMALLARLKAASGSLRPRLNPSREMNRPARRKAQGR